MPLQKQQTLDYKSSAFMTLLVNIIWLPITYNLTLVHSSDDILKYSTHHSGQKYTDTLNWQKYNVQDNYIHHTITVRPSA